MWPGARTSVTRWIPSANPYRDRRVKLTRPPQLLSGFLSVALTTALSAQQNTAFADMSETWGVLFQHKGTLDAGIMAGGAAFFDFDADGDEDLGEARRR